MSTRDEPRHELRVGDRVKLASVPDELLRTLSPADAAAVRAVVGKTMAIMGFDPRGQVELEFSTRELIFHTIWVPPSCVKKIHRSAR